MTTTKYLVLDNHLAKIKNISVCVEKIFQLRMAQLKGFRLCKVYLHQSN